MESDNFDNIGDYFFYPGMVDQHGSPFVDLKRTGNLPSRYHESRLPVPLDSTALGVGKCNIYPSLALGDTKIQSRLNLRHVSPALNVPYPDKAAAAGVPQRLTLPDYTNNSGGAQNVGVDVPLPVYTKNRDEDIDLWVGCPIRVRGQVQGGAAFDVLTYITAISRNPATGVVSINTSVNIAANLANNGVLTTLRLSTLTPQNYAAVSVARGTTGAAALGTTIPIQLMTDFGSAAASGLKVGDPVTVTFEYSGAADPISVDRTIATVNYTPPAAGPPAVAGFVTITLNQNVVTMGNNTSATGITVTSTNLPYANFTVNRASLVLHQLSTQDPKVTQFNEQMRSDKGWNWSYLTLRMEAVNNPQSYQYFRQYDLEPRVVNAYLLAPATGQLISYNDNVDRVRHRLNDIEVLSKDVKPNSQLDNMLKLATYENSIQPREIKNLGVYYGQNTRGEKFMSCLPITASDREQTLHIELATAAPGTLMNAKVFYLYKEQVRTLQIKNGQVRII